MPPDVVTAAEDTPRTHVADPVVRRRIDRSTPIVRGESLAGTVTRGDLWQGLRALLPATVKESATS